MSDTEPVADLGLDVASLLLRSRGQHTAYRYAVHLGHPDEARIALKAAADLRAQAYQLDPQRIFPAWIDDAQTHPHDDLMVFYAKELAK